MTSSWVAGSTPADLVFSTNPGAGLVTRMTIEDTGDIIMSDGLGWGGGGILPTSDITLTTPLQEFLSFFNGTFEETFDALVTEAAGVVTMSIEQSGTGDLTMRFSSGLSILDCTPPATIVLTAGTNAVPQPNWIYIPESTGVLTKSLTSWPSVEHIKVGYFLVPSAAFVASDGCYVNQNWNDHAAGTDGQGHQSHMGERIRLSGAQWFSGLDPAGVDDYLTIVGTTVDLKITSGIVWQMHEHTSTAFDTSVGDVVLVKNWFGDAYHNITNLFDIVQDSTGGTLNNRWMSFVVLGIANKTGEYDPVIINLPSGSYTSQTGAENDLNGYTDFRIPRQFIIDSSTAFYIARIVVRVTGTTWTYGSYVDLRGLTPGATAAGGGTGGATSFSDGLFNIFNSTDPTKIMVFDASGITTGTTRALTIQDADGTIAYLSDITFPALDDLTNVTDTSAAAGWFIRSSAAATWVTQLGITEADITDLGPYLLLAGGDLTGPLTITEAVGATALVIDSNNTPLSLISSAAGTNWIQFNDAGTLGRVGFSSASAMGIAAQTANIHINFTVGGTGEVQYNGVEIATLNDLTGFITEAQGDVRYGQLAAANAWSAVNTFSDAVELGTVGTLDVTGALAYFASTGSIELMVDDNNIGTAFFFRIATDGGPGAGTTLLQIDDDGSAWSAGPFGVDGSIGTPDLSITGGAFAKISTPVTFIQYDVAANQYHYFTVNNAAVGFIGTNATEGPYLKIGSSISTDLRISEPTATEWTMEARSTNLLVLKTAAGTSTPTGQGVYIDDGATNKAKAASVKNITSSGTAPVGDYPYGTLHLIY